MLGQVLPVLKHGPRSLLPARVRIQIYWNAGLASQCVVKAKYTRYSRSACARGSTVMAIPVVCNGLRLFVNETGLREREHCGGTRKVVNYVLPW